MRKVAICGLKDYAESAHYYLTHDSTCQVVAFGMHRQYLPPEAEKLAISSTGIWF